MKPPVLKPITNLIVKGKTDPDLIQYTPPPKP
jgi:hypothetical protein